MKPLILKTQKGFTLIEVVGAVVIVGLAITAILGMFSISNKSRAANTKKFIAYNLLQRKIEETKLIGFAETINENIPNPYGIQGYTLTVARQPPPYNGNSFLKKVDVTITWSSPFGGTQSETISTLIAKR